MGISLDTLRSAEVNNFTLLRQVGAANAERTDALQNQADMMDLLGAKSAKAAEAIRQLSTADPILIIPDDELRKLDAVGDKISAITLALKNLGAFTLGAGFNIAGKDAAFTKALLLLSVGVKPDAKTLAAMVGVDLKEQKPPTTGDVAETDFSLLNGGGYNAAVQAIESARKDRPRRTGVLPEFRSNAAGALQSMGGYWFGAEDSSKQDLAAMRADIKRIADSVNKVATQ
jgi:hypothetical protein